MGVPTAILCVKEPHAVKRGASTIVLMSSIRQHMASLPDAIFSPRN